MPIRPEMPLRCAACRSVGMLHCHDPEHCGQMQPSHDWVPAHSVGLARDWTVCRNCGFILRGDRENEAAACKGRVRVELRESPDTQPVVDLTPRCCP